MKFIKNSYKEIEIDKKYKAFDCQFQIYFSSTGVFTINQYSRKKIKVSNYIHEFEFNICLENENIKRFKKYCELVGSQEIEVFYNYSYELKFKLNSWNINFFTKEALSIKEIKKLMQEEKKNLIIELDYNQAKELRKKQCLSSDLSQIAFTGFYIDFENKKIITTDGKRLHLFNANFLSSSNIENCIIEPKELLNSCKKMKKKDDNIKIHELNGEIYINNILCEKINGKFPNYQEVIPNNYEHKIKIIDSVDCIKQIKQILPSCDPNTGKIKIEIDNNKMIFSGSLYQRNYYKTQDTKTSESLTEIEIENITNSKGIIYTQYNAFIDLLKNNKESIIEINNSSSPIKLTSNNFMGVCMPIKDKNKTEWTKNTREEELKEIHKSMQEVNQYFRKVLKKQDFEKPIIELKYFENNKKHSEIKKNKVVTMKKGTKKDTLQALKEIKESFNPTLERIKELINTINQYHHEERLESLENDLKKSEFNGLKYQDYFLLVGKIQDHDLELLYRLEENQGSSITDAKKEEYTDIIPVEKIDVVAEKILNEVFEISQPQFIIKFYTNKDKNKVYSPDVFKVDFSDESIIESNGYKYKIENMGKIRFHKGGKGSAYVNFALGHRPTIDEIKDLSNQFMEQLAQ